MEKNEREFDYQSNEQNNTLDIPMERKLINAYTNNYMYVLLIILGLFMVSNIITYNFIALILCFFLFLGLVNIYALKKNEKIDYGRSYLRIIKSCLFITIISLCCVLNYLVLVLWGVIFLKLPASRLPMEGMENLIYIVAYLGLSIFITSITFVVISIFTRRSMTEFSNNLTNKTTKSTTIFIQGIVSLVLGCIMVVTLILSLALNNQFTTLISAFDLGIYSNIVGVNQLITNSSNHITLFMTMLICIWGGITLIITAKKIQKIN